MVFEDETELRSYKLRKLMNKEECPNVKYLHIRDYSVSDINRSKVYSRKADAEKRLKKSSKRYLLRDKSFLIYKLKREEFENIIEWEKTLLRIEYERQISKLDVKKSKYKD